MNTPQTSHQRRYRWLLARSVAKGTMKPPETPATSSFYESATYIAGGYSRSYHLHICRTFPQLYDMKDDVVRLETARDILLRLGRAEDWLARTRLHRQKNSVSA
jgi:hypothetical protein